MSKITIESCRSATEKLMFDWPDRQPNTDGEFIGMVTCNVINPGWPKITEGQVTWAVDHALSCAPDEGCSIEEFTYLSSLKWWLTYAPLEINLPPEQTKPVLDNKIASLRAQVDELKVLTRGLTDKVSERHAKLEALSLSAQGGKVGGLKNQVDEVSGATCQILEKLDERGEKLEALGAKAERLSDSAREYSRSVNELARRRANPALALFSSKKNKGFLKDTSETQVLGFTVARTEQSKVCTIL